jgi:hypothetical protein
MAGRLIYARNALKADHVSDWMSDPRVAEFKQDSGKVNPQYIEPVRKFEDGMDTGGNTVD